MPSASSRLEILLEAKNNASSVLNQVKSDASGLSGALTAVGGAFGIAFGVEGVAKLAEAGVEMARAGAEAERLATGFSTLATQAGQSGDQMLAAMHKASQGTIADSQLMLDANKAMLLGVTNNSQQMTQLMEVAAARGHAMGLSTAQAFDMITEGIGRKAERQLKSVGIDVDAAAANAAYATTIGLAADKLDEQQQKQALLNAVVKDSATLVKANAGALRDAAGDFEAYDTAVTNAKEAVGQFLAPGVALGANVATAYLDGQVKMLQNETAALNSAWVASKNFATGGHDVTTATLAMAKAEGHADGITRNLTFGMINLGAEAENTGHKLLDMGIQGRAAMEQFNVAMSLSQDIAGQISSAANQAGVLFGAKQGGDAGLSKQKAVTTELAAQNQQWLNMGYTQQDINDVLLPAYVQNLNDADQATFKVATGTAQISDAASQASQAFDDLKGKVQGVLQGALDTGTGVDPQKALEAMGFPREDAINENARRLADIAANGLKNQDWLGQFQNEVPDIWKMIRLAQNPQEEAAHLLQDFQDGLLTSPIDKDKAKEIVRRQIMGDANMAALATEIAGELSTEMGVPMQQALAAAQGTMGGGAGMGGEMASQFSDAALAQIDGSNTGATIVTTTITQMRSQYPLLATAGQDAGKSWSSGFLDYVSGHVPPALVTLLAELVTPAVQAKFAQRATLQAATP